MRVTDRETMDIVEMVLGGHGQQGDRRADQPGRRQGGRPHRSGRRLHPRAQDAAARKERPAVDIGQVGEIESIDPSVISRSSTGGFIPVVAPIGVGADGETYNINADLVAGKLAEILGREAHPAHQHAGRARQGRQAAHRA
jgi:acetylglutamate kinase